jgi:hypothetical protein
MAALKAQLFPHKLRGKLAVLLVSGEQQRQFYGAGKGAEGFIEMYATAPVWVRLDPIYANHVRDTGRARWQCLARVTDSVCTEAKPGMYPKFRTTFVLIGDPEETRPPGY